MHSHDGGHLFEHVHVSFVVYNLRCSSQTTIRDQDRDAKRAGKFPGILETFHGKFREF